MYAVIVVGGKQYSVQKGDIVEVEKLKDVEDTKDITIEKVLLVAKEGSLDVGRPYVKGAHVKIQILGDFKARKVVSYKYKRRKSKDWKKGHRQQLMRIKITDIVAG